MFIFIASLLGWVLWTTAEPRRTSENASRHPTVYLTAADVERARKRIQTDPTAKAWFDSIKKSVAEWDGKDPDWIRSVVPGEGACFAYGFTGCPICAGSWGTWGQARASFDKPGHVICSNGHVLPDKDHPDPGTGYVGKDKRVHYFVGSYNAWVVETLIFKLAKPCATIHLLTGDPRAGRMAAVVLDEIARIYPSCDKGSWDYPSDPPSGRLNRPWYQVARVLVHLVDIYDRIFDHPALEEPSSRAGLTRRQNIEKNLLLNGATYCYDMSVRQGGLHNGQADYLRGALAVGVLLGIPEYITWAVDGPYGIRAMLANNVDRDGQYFETSASYGWHTRDLYLTFSEPLLNYRGPVFPNGLNLYDDPKFEAFYFLPQMATVCLGQNAPYGDMAPTWSRRSPPYNPPDIWDCRYTEYLAARVSDPKRRAEYAALLDFLRSQDPDADQRMMGVVEWRVFHKPDDAPVAGTITDRMRRYLDGSFFVGQKGLAVLRMGQGVEAHAAILRFGPSLVHGHLDDLNVNYFAGGYEVSYDLGYALGSTHTQVGWAKQTISHNTVVVDETSHGGGTFGGSLHHFADLPGLVLAEASSTVYEHAGVKVYRRLIALTDRYALDVFRVRGGRRHDLPFHSLSTEVAFDGLQFGEPQPGSLAGKDYAWGERQLNDGDMKGYPNKPYWNPPPGNGYGFLVKPAFARPSGPWSATWLFKDPVGTRFRLLPLEDPDVQVVTAVGPGLYPSYPKARHVIRRRQAPDLSSCFVTIWETCAGDRPPFVKAVRRIDDGKDLSAESAIALVVDLQDGQRDLWCLGPDADSAVTGKDGDLEVSARGAIARCRLKGKDLVSVELLDARYLTVAGWRFEPDSPHRTAVVVELPSPGSNSIRIDSAWPQDRRYDGNPLYVNRPDYSRNTAYVLKDITSDRLLVEQTDTILGRGIVHQIPDEHTLVTRVPHEYARSVVRTKPSGFFRGKWLQATPGGAGTRIRQVEFASTGAMTIRVDSAAGFSVGQVFHYHDLQPGDEATIQHHLALTGVSPRTYALRTNTDVKLVPPGQGSLRILGESGRDVRSPNGVIRRAELPTSGPGTVSWSP